MTIIAPRRRRRRRRPLSLGNKQKSQGARSGL